MSQYLRARRLTFASAMLAGAALAACSDDAEISSSKCREFEILVDGRCQVPCNKEQPCPAGYFCGAGAVCLQGCTATGCSEGQVCDDKSLQCRTACVTDADCSGDVPECLKTAAAPFCVGCADNGHEPNDTPATALAVAGTSSGAAVAGERLCANDADWYAYTAPEALSKGGLLSIFVDQEGGRSDVRLIVLDNDAATPLLDRTPDATGLPTQVQLLNRGPYFIGLSTKTNAEAAQPRYTLRLDASVTCRPDSFEPNNGSSQAAELGDKVGALIEGLSLCGGDEDWYRFQVRNGQVVELSANAVSAADKLRVALYRRQDDGTISFRAGGAADASSQSVTYRSQEDGVFLLSVARQGNGPGAYALKVDMGGEVCDPDKYEPNDHKDAATALSDDGNGNLTPGTSFDALTLCGGDSDYFKMALANGQVIQVDLSFSTGDLGLALYQVDSQGVLIQVAGSDTLTRDEHVTYRAVASGSYQVRVYPSRGSNPTKYKLSVKTTGKGCSPDTFEPNDLAEEATLLSADQDGNLTASGFEALTNCYGDDDWFQTTLQAGQLLSADVAFPEGDLGLQIYYRMPDGSLAYGSGSDGVSQSEHAEMRAFKDGVHFLRVYRSRGTGSAAYSMNARIVGSSCSADAHEANDDWTKATRLHDDGSGVFTKAGFDQLSLCYGDIDWYKLDLKNGQTVNVDVLFDNADLGVWMGFAAPDGSLLGLTSSDNVTPNEHLTYTALWDGTYVIQVYRSRGTVAAAYRLSVQTGSGGCAADVKEPNNAPKDAAALADDGAGNLTASGYDKLTVCYGDDDWFRFTLGNGQLATVDALFATSLDMGLQVYQEMSDGTLMYVAGSDVVTGSEHTQFRALAEGTYYARVYRSRGTAWGTYQLKVAVSGAACKADAFEPNDTQQEATALVDDGAGNFTAGAQFAALTNCYGDDDWFRFPMGNGQLATLDVTFPSGDLAIYGYQLLPDGTLSYVAGADAMNTTGERIQWRALGAGTYYARVVRSRGTVSASYKLALTVAGPSCSDDAKEPNNDPKAATRLVDDGNGNWTASGFTGLTNCYGDEDYFWLTATNGQLITADLTFPAGDLGLYLYYQQSDGTLAGLTASDGTMQSERVTYRALYDGVYYVRVYRSRGTAAAAYDLSVKTSGSACAADKQEPNDSYTAARKLSDDGAGNYTKVGFDQLSLCYGDDDWYSLEVENGQKLAVEASPASGDLGLQIYRIDSYGVLTYANGSDYAGSAPEIIAHIVQYPGTYFVRVYPSRGTPSLKYALSVKVGLSVCAPDPFEPNDSWAQASPLAFTAGAAKLTKVTNCYGDDDWYSFSMANSQLLDADIRFDFNAVDLALYAYRLDSNGVLQYVAGSDGLGTNEAFSAVALYDGTYFLRVVRSRGAVAGEYDLNARITGLACAPDSLEPNDHYMFPKAITLNAKGGPALAMDNLTVCYGEVDYYSFSANVADVLNIQLNPIYDGDLGLYLYEQLANGTLSGVSSSDVIGGNEGLVYAVPSSSTGKYIVYVYRSYNAYRSKYQLQIKR